MVMASEATVGEDGDGGPRGASFREVAAAVEAELEVGCLAAGDGASKEAWDWDIDRSIG